MAQIYLGLGSNIDASENLRMGIRELECRYGELERSQEKFASRPLDIDLLLYDDLVIDQPPLRLPRSDVLEYSFVLRPLAELAPELVHPVTGRTMSEHWEDYDAEAMPLTPVSLIL